eukprot:scaffold123314_cov17-Tisochrysis_lutea.AAC.1
MSVKSCAMDGASTMWNSIPLPWCLGTSLQACCMKGGRTMSKPGEENCSCWKCLDTRKVSLTSPGRLKGSPSHGADLCHLMLHYASHEWHCWKEKDGRVGC